MPTIGNFRGSPILQMPATPAPKSVEWSALDIAAVSTSPFSGNQQVYDWQAGYLAASVTLPPLTHAQAQTWIAWLLALRGPVGVFALGDRVGKQPRGSALGIPVVASASQTGYRLVTSGWQASAAGVLLPGDWLQVGQRLYRNLEAVNADSSGGATLSIWPNLREAPSAGAPLTLLNTTGLWRLRSNIRKWSVSEARIYGFSFDIQEAL